MRTYFYDWEEARILWRWNPEELDCWERATDLPAGVALWDLSRITDSVSYGFKRELEDLERLTGKTAEDVTLTATARYDRTREPCNIADVIDDLLLNDLDLAERVALTTHHSARTGEETERVTAIRAALLARGIDASEIQRHNWRPPCDCLRQRPACNCRKS